MRRILSLASGLVLALTMTAPATAAAPPIRINPFHMDEVTVTTSDSVILEVRWGACSKSLDQRFIGLADVAWTVDGIDFPTKTKWTKPEPVVIEGTSPCVSGTTTGWYAYGQSPTSFPTPGVYVIAASMTTRIAITDGGDYDGDGIADLMGGPGQEWFDTVTVTVIP